MNNKTKYSVIALTTIAFSAVGFMIYTRNSRAKLYKELMSGLQTQGTGKEVPVTESEALNPTYWKQFSDKSKYMVANETSSEKNATYFYKLLVTDTIIDTDKVVVAIKNLQTKTNLSKVADHYKTKYNRSLSDDLTHVGWLFISKDAVPKAIASLPNVLLIPKK